MDTNKIPNTVANALMAVLVACQSQGLSIEIEYDNGLYVPGEYAMVPENEMAQYIRQGKAGWTIWVGGQTFESGDPLHEITMYPTIDKMVVAGMDLVKRTLLNNKNNRPNIGVAE